MRSSSLFTIIFFVIDFVHAATADLGVNFERQTILLNDVLSNSTRVVFETDSFAVLPQDVLNCPPLTDHSQRKEYLSSYVDTNFIAETDYTPRVDPDSHILMNRLRIKKARHVRSNFRPRLHPGICVLRMGDARVIQLHFEYAHLVLKAY